MLGLLIVLTLIVIVYVILSRKPLLFALRPVEEAEAKIVDAEFCRDGGEKPRDYFRCKLEYVVESKSYHFFVERQFEPRMDERVVIAYPKGHPKLAIEGSRRDVASYLTRYAIISFIFLAFIVFAQVTRQ
ncbi:hypothetical protein [Methylocystis hirsuta]|uniref:DUF3592 domain-containing protein n=1 Tax=Methylocystis hirsuta TaxID=369798 RepID=A0A3M9XNL1_9HYPH|nr:hypothetical protein [Methylocystis hirsuta]RNJ49907.1 hypothetical protein D1O30_10140 [Methylocystis hirsuta]